MKNKAKFKFNNGNLAIICSRCAKIIKVGYEFTELEMMACRGIYYLPPQYCNECKNGFNETKTR